MICPQLITFGSVRPKNESPASNKMADPTIKADWTIIGGSAFGRMTKNINFHEGYLLYQPMMGLEIFQAQSL